MSDNQTQSEGGWRSVMDECVALWKQLPDKSVFLILLAGWIGLFQFFGNSTLGYTNTHSIFSWLAWVYRIAGDDDIGRFMPFVVLGLIVWKRKVLMEAPKARWWPGLVMLAGALVIHVLGYFVQQTRVSLLAFILGLYAIMGIVWGPRWLRAIFFPFVLFAFSVPLSSEVDTVTLQMRLWATTITTGICELLGVNLVQVGTRIMDASGGFQYEVAAACSGIRSLTATLTLAVIYAFVSFRGWGRRFLIIASAFPLAILANVFRLTLIIIAAEAFGQSAGDYVHTSAWLSLLPYVPAFIGLAALGRLLREDRPDERIAGSGLQQPV